MYAREVPPTSRRRIRRHLLLAMVAGALGLMLVLLFERDRTQTRLSMAMAYVALAFLGATLVLGPARVIRDKHSPANSYLRRDVGIWAGILSLAHVALGLTVHFPGSMWKYFFDQLPSLTPPYHLRSDAFGLANHTGLGSALLLILLLVLSNDRSLRVLGTPRWKRLQRWSYVAFGLMAVHGGLYQILEARSLPWIGVFGAVVAGVTVVQLIGFAVKKSRRGS